MAIKTEAIGKEWPATTYEVGRRRSASTRA